MTLDKNVRVIPDTLPGIKNVRSFQAGATSSLAEMPRTPKRCGKIVSTVREALHRA